MTIIEIMYFVFTLSCYRYHKTRKVCKQLAATFLGFDIVSTTSPERRRTGLLIIVTVVGSNICTDKHGYKLRAHEVHLLLINKNKK